MQPPHSFTPDLVGRTLVETRPDGEAIVYGYDANENRTSVTPPNQPSHALDFTPVDLLGVENDPINKVDPTGLAKLFCRKPEHGDPCAIKCASAGIVCGAIAGHPYKAGVGVGQLFCVQRSSSRLDV